MFLVSLNSVGAPVRAIPLKEGPRHCGQCAGSATAELGEELTAKVLVNNASASTLATAIHLFIPLVFSYETCGVKPSTISNRAASSPMREVLIGAKSTITDSRA